MFFKCHKCSKPDDQVTLKLEGDKIVCPRCGDVVRENFIEKDGVVAGVHDINFDMEPGDYIFLQRTSDDPDQNMHLIISEVFHREPYLDGKKVKKYSFSGRYTIKVYYE
jgi:recombinational DNA repair protein (RecF pathway)